MGALARRERLGGLLNFYCRQAARTAAIEYWHQTGSIYVSRPRVNFGERRSLDLPDGRAIDYLVDSENRRVAKKINGEVVRKWSDSKMALEKLTVLVDLDVMSTYEFLGHMCLGRT